MQNYICVTCGIQYTESETEPDACPICQDDRQYVNSHGQQWTTLENLRRVHKNVFREEEPRLTGIVTEPKFAIGQRALLIEDPENGNILWDCISLIDDNTVAEINQRGGLSAIAISHPHFYDSMVEWSHAFGGVPIYLHEDNREWVMRPDDAIQFWEGHRLQLNSHVTLIRCGGHFPGSSVLYWSQGAQGRGALLTGDTIYPVQDSRYVTFMYSYPNMIPLNASAVKKIVAAVEPYEFDRIYSGWFDRTVASSAKNSVAHSASRYIRMIEG